MKQDWKFGVLDDAVDRGSSNISLNKIKDDDGEFPVFGAKGFIQNASFYQQENQYLAIIKDGAGIGRVSTHPEKSSVLATMQYILPKQSYDIKFLYYFLNSIDFNKYRTGSTIPHIYYKNYKLEPFPLVSKEEQKQIVVKLDRCFEAIDKARANAAKNLENAKELFQSKLNDIFSQKGEGWVEKKLGEISDVTYGFTDKSVEVGDFRYVRITDIDNNGELISTGKKYISSSKDGKKFILKDNDILMARTGATFAKLLLYKDIEPSIFASYLIKIDFTESIDNEFYWFYAKSNSYWDQANTLSTGSAQPHFNGKALKQVLFPYPVSKTEQSRLINEFKRFQSKTQSLESKYQQELNSLEELKKSILQKAFEGEL